MVINESDLLFWADVRAVVDGEFIEDIDGQAIHCDGTFYTAGYFWITFEVTPRAPAGAIVKGIEDALSGTEPMLPRDEMHATLTELKRKVVADEQTQLRKNRRQRELEYLAEGKKFMEENAARPDVKSTASGLQYKILQPGTGKSPRPTDAVTVNYRGTQINGNEFVVTIEFH